MSTEFNDVFVEIIIVCADSSDSQKLAVGDAVLASLWVCRIIVQIIVRVGGFCVQSGADVASF